MAATVKFKLNHPERKPKDTPVSINLLYYYEGDKIELSTGEKVPSSKWTGSRVRGAYKDYDKINRHLIRIEEELSDLWRNHKGVRGPELKQLVRKIVQGEPHPIQEVKKNNPFSEYVRKIIQLCNEGKIIRSKATIGQYIRALEVIEEFATKKGIELSFEAITLDFYYDLIAYLWDTLHYNDNTAGKIIKNIKNFMQMAFDDDLHTNIAFKKKKFRKPSFETDEIYLTSDEINRIYGLNLNDKPQLALHRDLFVFNCWVGIRFGDLCQLRHEQIIQTQEGKYLKIRTEKTGEDVVIPFHPLCEAIYSYYNGQLPIISKSENVVFNRHLKTIAELAKLTNKVTSKNIIRGKATITYHEKWEMVSAHTARRSFATNCYLMGVPTITIMAITGHKTEKAFLKYIRVTKQEHAKIMMDHFNKTPIMGMLRKAN
jgi:site-specific recombinase XerD